MEKRSGNTKEKILDAALMLFSERGYDGVGVDLIAETVGLKGPSLYRHFKGKEAILSGLVERFDAYYEDQFGHASELEEFPETIEELMEDSMKRILFTLHDPELKKVRKLLAIEQFRTQGLKELKTKLDLAGSEDRYTVLFDHLMDTGVLKEDDPRLLAFEFVSPITLMIHLCDREPKREEEVLNRIQRHMEHFEKIYGNVEEEE